MDDFGRAQRAKQAQAYLAKPIEYLGIGAVRKLWIMLSHSAKRWLIGLQAWTQNGKPYNWYI